MTTKMDDESDAMMEQTSRCKDSVVNSRSQMLSVIRPYGYSITKCGYCKGSRSNLIKEPESASAPSKVNPPSLTPHSTKSSASKLSLASKSYSVLADTVSPTLYEELIHMGWRRSGLHLYKPQNFSSCCPTLTTRLLTREFQLSKSQRRVLKKVEKLFMPSQGPRQRNGESVAEGGMSISTTTISTPTFTSKKQKRNHRKQQTMNGRNSSIVPTQQQNSARFDIGVERMASLVPTSIEEQIAATGVLQRLEQATTGAIEKYLSSSSIRSNFNDFVQEKSKDFKWKTRYRILPPSKRDRKRSQIKAVSSICSQICGQLRSSFSTDIISREQLVNHVVHAIKNAEDSMTIRNSNTTNSAIIPPNDRIISITSIEGHQPSGQILCTIRLNKENAEVNENIFMHDENQTSAEMNEPQSTERDNLYRMGNSEVNCCKLAQWYEKTTGKRLELEPNKQCITIETLPSHQSALNPDVHKLYAHYQHVVHGDPNPFTHDQNIKNMIGDNDKGDDEDEEPKIETDDPSELDWGEAPAYFTSEISTMLTSYIQPLDSKECRRAVLSNYYSFFQFLVEAPFPLNNVYDKHNHESENNNGRDMQNSPGLSSDTNMDKLSSRLPCGLYHQHYRIGGEFLIAVGVIDVLPTGLSSVYLFYHPSFSYELVALGKYAILKEIEFARDILKVPFYYLGY